MSLLVSDKGGKDFTPIPEGTYTAVCYGVIDLGKQYNEKFGQSSNKVLILWEFPEEIEEGQELPRTFSQRYTASLNAKSKLRKDLTAWRGRDFTEAELAEFNLANILGVPCLIQIIHRENAGKTYANMASIMALPKGTPRPAPKHELITFDLSEDELSKIDDMPEWIAELIKGSETYKERVDESRGKAASKPMTVNADDFDDGEDCPF